MADPAAPPVELTPEQKKANGQAHRKQDTRQLTARMQQGMRNDGMAGAKSAFLGMPVFTRGSATDSTPHGSSGGPGHMTDPQAGLGAYKYKLPYPTTAPAAPAGQAAPMTAAPGAAVAPAEGSLADAVAPQKKKTAPTFSPFGSGSRVRKIGGNTGGGGGGYGGGGGFF